MKKEKQAMKKNKTGKWLFLLFAFFLYATTAFLNFEIFLNALSFLKEIIFQLIPIFIFVYFLMVLVDRFVNEKTISVHMSKDKGVKGFMIMIVAGIISTGPIYAWYPFLSNLKEKGVSDGLLATFLYNRSIKIQFFPLLLSYFSLSYVLTLTLLMIFFSVIQGLGVNALMKKA
jgi:uncharacterized membrane protein YraQ (UPF0718 family)